MEIIHGYPTKISLTCLIKSSPILVGGKKKHPFFDLLSILLTLVVPEAILQCVELLQWKNYPGAVRPVPHDLYEAPWEAHLSFCHFTHVVSETGRLKPAGISSVVGYLVRSIPWKWSSLILSKKMFSWTFALKPLQVVAVIRRWWFRSFPTPTTVWIL